MKPERIIVTCGPSYEPIDEVRRITNFSTGELGILIANKLSQEGFLVQCLKGEQATCPLPLIGPQCIPFTSNGDLQRKLEHLSKDQTTTAFLHTAALSDFTVDHTTDDRGTKQDDAKISSAVTGLTVHLKPAVKVLSSLRSLFPDAWIAGWKYELNADKEAALSKGQTQISKNKTDACVVNGKAYGKGFGILQPNQDTIHLEDKPTLALWFAELMVQRRISG